MKSIVSPAVVQDTTEKRKSNDKLLRKALKRHMKFCVRTEAFKVLVFVERWSKRDIIMGVLSELCDKKRFKDKVKRIVNHSGAARVEFSNGSRTEMEAAKDRIRSVRMHSAIVDDANSEWVISNVLLPRLYIPDNPANSRILRRIRSWFNSRKGYLTVDVVPVG